MFDCAGFNPEQGLPPRKKLTNQGGKKAEKQLHWTASPAAVEAQAVSAARITQFIHMGVVHAQRPQGEALMAFAQSLLLTIPQQLCVALASAGLLLAVGRKDLRGSTLGNKPLQCLVWEFKLNTQDKKVLVEALNHLHRAIPLLFALESDCSPTKCLISFLLSWTDGVAWAKS